MTICWFRSPKFGILSCDERRLQDSFYNTNFEICFIGFLLRSLPVSLDPTELAAESDPEATSNFSLSISNLNLSNFEMVAPPIEKSFPSFLTVILVPLDLKNV